MSRQLKPVYYGYTPEELQKHLNVEKYVALAFGQPRGRKLQDLVEERWPEWCAQVNTSLWLRYWKKTAAYGCETLTPKGESLGKWGCGNVPLVVYTTAVWGFGVDDWCRIQAGHATRISDGKPGSTYRGKILNEPMAEILKLQGIKDLRLERAYSWDAEFDKLHDISIPAEFGMLDRWLDQLWASLK